MSDDKRARMTHNDPDRHLDDDLCLDLVAGLLRDSERAAAVEHLDRCPDCESKTRAIYGDRFLAETIWAKGEGLGSASTAVAGPRKPRVARRLRLYPVAASFLVAALLLLLFWPGERDSRSQDPDVALVRTLIEQRSSTGFALVGSGTAVSPRPNDYRTGGQDADAQLTDALETLEARQRRNETTADQAYWIAAGRTELGQFSRARALLPSVGSPAVHETRWLVLAAQIAYRESCLDQARQLLEEALAQDPKNSVVAFDLGLVLLNQGDVEAARPYLRAVQEASPESRLGQRAATLLESAGPTSR